MNATERTAPLGWPQLFDPRHAGNDSMLPYLVTAQLLARDATLVVNVGCGRGQVGADLPGELGDLRAPGRRVIGLDIDPKAGANPVVDEFRLIGPDSRWPLGDATVDLCISDWTLEHVREPEAFVSELARVLRPGGAFVARTVSRYSVLSVFARTVPSRWHAPIVTRLQPGREARDVFPTEYRMNRERDLARLLDGRFEWAAGHYSGLREYLRTVPKASRRVEQMESRLPRELKMSLVVFARRLDHSADQ